MSHRLLTVWVVSLSVCVSLMAACGSGASHTTSTYDSGTGDMTGHLDAGHSDVTLKPGNDAAHMLTMPDSGGTSTCKPKTCAELGVGCGPQGDGCGNALDCGSCTSPETCGGGGVPNVCGEPNPDAGDGSTSIPTGTLTIAPLNDAITVPYGTTSPTVAFSAQVGGQPVSASFSIDLGQVAAVNPSTGIVTPSGLIGGVTHVTATFGTQTVTTPLTVAVQLTNNGNPSAGTGADAGTNYGGNNGVGGQLAGGAVSTGTQMTLQGTPTTDSSLSWLYPYDNTVWPQGILAPLLQWNTSKTYDGVYIQLKENAFSYQGYFATTTPGKPFVNLPILQSAWDTLVYSNQGEAVSVSLTFSSGGVAYGPLTETWKIAQGTLTGTVYYNSYGTALAVNYKGTAPYSDFGAATLAIKHGATSPVLIAGQNGITSNNSNCRVCHSVAAGGATLITQQGNNDNQSSAYSLTAGNTETVMPPANESAGTATYAFAAIEPNGAFLLSNTGPLPGTSPPNTSGLFSIPSGAAITSTGLPTGFSAATPAFSPDGQHVAFNQYGVDKVSLGAMGFDPTTNAFSALIRLTTPPSGDTDLFPAFLPTNDAVIFEREVASDGEFGATRSVSSTKSSHGELWWVDLKTQTAAPLTTLNGGTYLPNFGTNHANDATLQYEPTVNPVPSGGYAWVVFTSRRLYGNVATQDPFLSDPRNYDATTGITTKKLWVAAIDLNAPAGSDPSHPAFYLPAQELHACNSRGYWVVDPCEASGTSCLTGDQCCSGYCGQADGGATVCGTQPPGCAVLGNKCAANSDCCGSSSGISCIDGFCAQPGHTVDAGMCTPTTCAKLGSNCGPAGDGCGGLIECGTCASPQTCGGGGVSGVCGAPKGPDRVGR